MNEAYADVPAITTFVADDPDNLDAVYSNDDTFTLTFSLPINVTASATMSQGAIDGNFTLSGVADFGTTYAGLWSADRLTLLITVTNIAASTDPIIATTTIVGCTVPAVGCIGHAAAEDNPTGPTISPALTGDYGDGVLTFGSDCSRDCTPPTLGPGTTGKLIVTDGFSYNGYATDVSQWHTEYPLIVVETGKTNVLQAKIYDDWGLSNIKAIRVAFGVPEIGQFYNGETIVEYYPNGILGPQINIVDKQNLLDRVKITTAETSCNDGENSPTCLLFTMQHMFREAPLDNIVGISVGDKTRNGAQFYFNDGIEVEGESLNPPATATVPQHTRSGGIIQLTQIDRAGDIWIDEQDNIWTKNSYDTWFKLTPDAAIKIDVEPISKQGINRNHAYFKTFSAGQELLAKQIWNSEEIQAELPDTVSIAFEGKDRMDNPELQKAIINQIQKAQEIFEKEFGKVTSD